MLERLRAVRQNARRNQDGFTLIELLIVIIILGVLAGIVVFAVNGIIDRGTLSACKADKNTVATASEAYYAKNSKWATAIDDSSAGPPPVPASATSLVGAGFLQNAPSNSGYKIFYDNTTGNVTSDLANC